MKAKDRINKTLLMLTRQTIEGSITWMVDKEGIYASHKHLSVTIRQTKFDIKKGWVTVHIQGLYPIPIFLEQIPHDHAALIDLMSAIETRKRLEKATKEMAIQRKSKFQLWLEKRENARLSDSNIQE